MEKIKVLIYVLYAVTRLLIRYFFAIGKQPVYIAGKISGLDFNEVKTKFSEKETQLRSKKLFPVNPVRLCVKEVEWIPAMRICMAMLSLCEMIYLLPDCKNSKGAILEHEHAQRLCMPVYFYKKPITTE